MEQLEKTSIRKKTQTKSNCTGNADYPALFQGKFEKIKYNFDSYINRHGEYMNIVKSNRDEPDTEKRYKAEEYVEELNSLKQEAKSYKDKLDTEEEYKAEGYVEELNSLKQEAKSYKGEPDTEKRYKAEEYVEELNSLKQKAKSYKDKLDTEEEYKAEGYVEELNSLKQEAKSYKGEPDTEKRYKAEEYVEELNSLKQEAKSYKDKLDTEEEYKAEGYVEELNSLKQEAKSYKDKLDTEEEYKAEGYVEELNSLKQEAKSYKGEPDTEKRYKAEGYVEELNSLKQEAKSYKSEHNDVCEEKNKGDYRRNFSYNDSNMAPYEYALKVLSKYDIRYIDSPKTSKLYIFNGKIWEPLQDMEDIAMIVYKEMPEGDRKDQNNIENFCKKVSDFIRYECREKYESGKERFNEDDFKAIDNRIVFKNGVYDIQTGEFMKHNKGLPYYIGINADYMKEDMATPMYDRLKKDATCGDTASMDMFDKMLGYLMIPNRSGKCYFVMSNAKDSGKSVFGHFIESIYMGNRVKTIDLEHLAGRFAMSNTDGIILLSGLEASMERLEPTIVAQIKRITGENKIRVETKYKNGQDVTIRFKLLLATNGAILLQRNASDDAFYRRTIIIPFRQSIEPGCIIADMPKRLWDERSAILSKAARRAGEMVLSNGGIHFPESQLSLGIKKTWTGGYDYDEVFIDNKLEFTGDPNDAIPKEDIFEQYRIFYKTHTRNNVTNAVMVTKNELMKRIMEVYPNVEAKKLRRDSMEHVGEVKLYPCMTRLKWKETAE